MPKRRNKNWLRFVTEATDGGGDATAPEEAVEEKAEEKQDAEASAEQAEAEAPKRAEDEKAEEKDEAVDLDSIREEVRAQLEPVIRAELLVEIEKKVRKEIEAEYEAKIKDQEDWAEVRKIAGVYVSDDRFDLLKSVIGIEKLRRQDGSLDKRLVESVVAPYRSDTMANGGRASGSANDFQALLAAERERLGATKR